MDEAAPEPFREDPLRDAFLAEIEDLVVRIRELNAQIGARPGRQREDAPR